MPATATQAVASPHAPPAATCAAQLEVLSTLADEQALHLLPPLRLLPGPSDAYLAAPADGSTSAFGRACFGAAAGGGAAGSGGGRRQDLDLYAKLLSEGALERCLAASSGNDDAAAGVGSEGRSGAEGNGACLAACSAAVPLVLHRLACACFAGTDGSGLQPAAGQERAQAHALLCSVLLRCSGPGSPELRRLVAMLLRWDTTAGQPSDAISQGRVAAIQAACGAAGLDSSVVLGQTLEA